MAHLVTLINIQTLQDIRVLPYCINLRTLSSGELQPRDCGGDEAANRDVSVLGLMIPTLPLQGTGIYYIHTLV